MEVTLNFNFNNVILEKQCGEGGGGGGVGCDIWAAVISHSTPVVIGKPCGEMEGRETSRIVLNTVLDCKQKSYDDELSLVYLLR